MTDRKNTRPDVGASERAKETGPNFQNGPRSRSQSTTSAPPGQKISDWLRCGRENAVTLKQLRTMLHMDGRTIRLAIERERRMKIPILSNSKDGYWLGEDPAEIAQFVRGMERRARQIQLTAQAVGKAVNKSE